MKNYISMFRRHGFTWIILTQFLSLSFVRQEFSLPQHTDETQTNRKYRLHDIDFDYDLDSSTYSAEKVVDGIIQSERVAACVADVVLISVYGDHIRSSRPYTIMLVGDSLWYVCGSIPKNWFGGVPEIWISAKDARIIRYVHGK